MESINNEVVFKVLLHFLIVKNCKKNKNINFTIENPFIMFYNGSVYKAFCQEKERNLKNEKK